MPGGGNAPGITDDTKVTTARLSPEER